MWFMGGMEQMRPWIKFNPTTQIDIIEYQRRLIENKACPKCLKKNLKVVTLEEGGRGWEAKVRCERCTSVATLNNTGFMVNFTEGKK